MGEETALYVHQDTGRIEDTGIERMFYSLYHDSLTDDDRTVLPGVMDHYTKQLVIRNNPVEQIGFDNALDDTDHAIKWAAQYGVVTVWKLTDEHRKAIPDSISHGTLWGARIGMDRDGQFVHAKTQRLAILLACVLYLREFADIINNDGIESTAKH